VLFDLVGHLAHTHVIDFGDAAAQLFDQFFYVFIECGDPFLGYLWFKNNDHFVYA
jgi:hypothetical protein